ncbi:Uncharacterised protein [uncultured archaeon]|nr:Uncharacterised protein [uncultured archaeon]
MKKKTVLFFGILAILLILGTAVALAQNTGEKPKNLENHECTPEMMKNMSENCPEQMMKSDACENMMKGSEMINNAGRNTNTAGENHCGDMGSDNGSMMGSSGADMKNMM